MAGTNKKKIDAINLFTRIYNHLEEGADISEHDIICFRKMSQKMLVDLDYKESSELANIVAKCLKEMDVAPNLRGNAYLSYAIQLVYCNEDYIGNITSMLYPDVAKRFNTKPQSVERCIRNAIENCWETNSSKEDDPEIIITIFGDDFYRQKPKNSHFISAIAEYIKLHI